MYTAGDFSRDMYRLTNTHGRPLTYDVDEIWYKYFVEEAADAGNKLPLTDTLGKLAVTTARRGHDDIDIQVAMLNESSRMMPDDGRGSIIGSVALAAVRRVTRHGGPVLQSSWSLDATLHNHGPVELSALDLRKDSAEGREILERLKVTDLLSAPATSDYLSLDASKGHTLHEDQLVSLRSFVVAAFAR